MRVILHVGLPKAASTSVQMWLRTHRRELLDAGVYVPTTGHRPDRHSPGGHTLGHDVLPRMMHWPWALRFWIDRFFREAAAQGADTVILSAENLTHPANVDDLPRFAEALQRHLARRQPSSIEIVLITRDPESWMESYYNEAVLNGRSYETRRFDAFRADMQARGLSAEALADRAGRCFHAPVHRIALGEVSGTGLFHRLSDLLGTPYLATTVRRQRVSPTPQAIEAQRARNAEFRTRPWRVGPKPRSLLRVFLSILPEKPYLAARRALRALSSFVAFAMLARRG